jgi:hypothetical protein
MDCNLDLEKVAKATVMKDGVSAAICIGEAVMEAAEKATRFFSGSMELDITAFVLERIELAKKAEPSETDLIRKKAAVVAGVAPKRRGRPPKSAANEG